MCHSAPWSFQSGKGSFYAFASFFQKLGTGAALWAMAQTLTLTGYIHHA
ncbi:MAG: hypothetical protein H8D78_13480 [Chloroflexi bacterium]|nr:hypothetical protein [Chloroflexota bacterium]